MSLQMVFSPIFFFLVAAFRLSGTGGFIVQPSAPTVPCRGQRFSPPPQTTTVAFRPVTGAVQPVASSLQMSSSEEGGGVVTKIALAGILFVFLASAVLPFMSEMQVDTGSSANVANSVVTRQDGKVGEQLRDYESKFDRLSRAKIQEKLGRVPAFYLVDKVNGRMGSEIFMSYEDAVDASKAGDGYVVKATTLNQVMYPLVLKRGRMMMPPPPAEVRSAEESLEEGGASGTFKLVPSGPAKKDAADVNLDLADGDLPLFVADRLAFAGSGGPQVPLFLEKGDALTSYNRLRESGGNKLPAEANIRTTTLFDELYSMEKGTRPGVKQLEFFASAEDLMRADALLQ